MIAVSLIIWPLVAALLVLFLNATGARAFSLFAGVVELGLVLFAANSLVGNQTTLLDYSISWISYLHSDFHVGIDGISMILVLLTGLLIPFIIWSVHRDESNVKTSSFYALILFMQAALIGVFISKDGFLFYIFWELALIPIYFICLRWGGQERGRITLKFFIYTLTGSLFMLMAFIYIYQHTPAPHSFDIQVLYQTAKSLNSSTQGILFLGLFLAFAIKMPIFPLHTWQPETYTMAPAQGTMLLSGIMLKMGTYGVIRWLLPMVPLGVVAYGKLAIVLSIAGVLYASCIALVQTDLKKLFAYSSIAHVGLISAGMFTNTKIGIQGALLQMVSHGIIVVALFYIAEILWRRTKTLEIADMGGIRLQSPFIASAFMITMLGSIALPLTSGFVGEFLLINSIFRWNAVAGILAGFSIILGATYMLRAYQKTMLGDVNTGQPSFEPLSIREKVILVLLGLLILLLGVFPSLIMNISEQAVDNLLNIANLKIN
ncbi:MAG: NADH-quinone oxidoreductase subunit M [Saprospiraceae bacterium]